MLNDICEWNNCGKQATRIAAKPGGMIIDICEWENCGKQATRIAAKPGGMIIDICDECWHTNYRS